MKSALYIALSLLAVLPHLAKAMYHEKCLSPYCLSPGILDSNSCICNLNGNSKCPKGFTAVQEPHIQCFCEKIVSPVCKRGFIFDSKTCTCGLEEMPKCPSGGSLSPYTAVCISTAEPMCPPGSNMIDGCRCIQTQERVCREGRLSSDECTCEAVDVAKPICEHGCTLTSNNGACRCESSSVRCFGSSRHCEGFSYIVPTEAECCADITQQRSYVDDNGACRPCFH